MMQPTISPPEPLVNKKLQTIIPQQFLDIFKDTITSFKTQQTIFGKEDIWEIIEEMGKQISNKRKLNHSHLTIYLDVESPFGQAGYCYDKEKVPEIINIFEQAFSDHDVKFKIFAKDGTKIRVTFSK